MFGLGTPKEVHGYLRQYATHAANQAHPVDTMAWHHSYSVAYRTNLVTYHGVFQTPTNKELELYRRELGETVMEIVTLPLWR
jgi:hypothetical protein